MKDDDKKTHELTEDEAKILDILEEEQEDEFHRWRFSCDPYFMVQTDGHQNLKAALEGLIEKDYIIPLEKYLVNSQKKDKMRWTFKKEYEGEF